ncbi:hypothetical protein SAMD00023353_5000160 [Rosellinia necatrix]|uniref:Uncharacterized protein n=1 Tax=Rosellinia necatrix TaxID=77044 RepID=A0A1S8A9J3_ROSNE|nr:hypothetical protein SAMD00023353_5000160 [Rosellinia necatrix]
MLMKCKSRSSSNAENSHTVRVYLLIEKWVSSKAIDSRFGRGGPVTYAMTTHFEHD